MTNTVVFPPSPTFPSGMTISDDSDPTTGLGNGGHRVRFVPALKGALQCAGDALDRANSAASSRDVALQAASDAILAQGVVQTVLSGSLSLFHIDNNGNLIASDE